MGPDAVFASNSSRSHYASAKVSAGRTSLGIDTISQSVLCVDQASSAREYNTERWGSPMTKEDGNPRTLEDLLAELRRRLRTVAADDLSGLAKMHGICETVIEKNSLADDDASSRICDLARTIGTTLEALILGESEDAAASLASIGVNLEALTEVAATKAPAATGDEEHPEPSAAAPVELTDQEVGARLDAVLDTTEDSESTAAAGESTASDHQAEESAGVQEGALTASTEGAFPEEPEPYQAEPLVIQAGESEFVNGFLEEAREHLEAIETALLEVENAPDDPEKIDSLFRPFHTIKGMAGFLNLRDINCLTHEVETLLDQGRKGKRPVTPGLIDIVFDVVDILKVQIAAIANWIANPEGDTIPQPPVAEMIGRLRNVVSGRTELEGREPTSGAADQKVGENLVDQGAVPKEVVDFAVQSQQAGEDDKKVGEILVGMGATSAKQVSQALRPQQKTPAAPSGIIKEQAALADQSIRIDTAKLDGLVDMVGELVIAQTLVGASPHISTDAKLSKNVAHAGKIVRDVQEMAMSMRMIPIGSTFQKMARLVRDVSRKAGKQVQLSISGEDTELDKTVIQQIGDPLVHMVRNAVDHGIESADGRRAAGKPETGQVHLGAFHQGGNIVIEIRDDGQGLDPELLKAKAIDKGVISPHDDLTDQQAYGLIFAPGFSTAAQVTDISGRGVGMDVVKRNIEQLRGKVEITSTKGKGTTFWIRLPLTLAIIDGMIVRVGSERFILQTIGVEQSLRPRPEQITKVQDKGEILNVRGRLIPLLQLGAMFGYSKRVDPCKAMIIIANSDDQQIGLVVDELIGQQQVVIKPLGRQFESLRGISGSAILGDGRVGLILEMTGLLALHNEWQVPPIEAEVPDPTPAAESFDTEISDHEEMDNTTDVEGEAFPEEAAALT